MGLTKEQGAYSDDLAGGPSTAQQQRAHAGPEKELLCEWCLQQPMDAE